MKATLFAAALCLQLASGCTPAVRERSGTPAGTAATYGGDADAGRMLFAARCATCHGATGVEGGSMGISLRNESSRMNYAATVSWIEDPAPPMPKLYPKFLTGPQVRDVAKYVQSL